MVPNLFSPQARHGSKGGSLIAARPSCKSSGLRFLFLTTVRTNTGLAAANNGVLSAFSFLPPAALCSSLLALCLLFGGCSSALTPHRAPASLSTSERTTLNLKIYDAAWQLVNDKYFDPQFRGVDWAAMRTKYRATAAAAMDEAQLYRVLDRLCAELKESHLTPLPPRRAQEIRTSRRMAVGMGWIPLEGRLVVTDLIPGGPAAAAGVQPGWVVLSCEGRPLTDAPPLPPQQGRTITFGFLDLKNEARAITFQPELLKVGQLLTHELPGGIRYLRFDKFDRESLRWLSRQLKEHRDAPGVVLDLRENPGGYIYAANLAIGEFFDHRVPTGQFVRRSGRISEGHGLPFFSARYEGPLAVLTGPATGSAAEIFAHVMQHNRRGTVIGRRTAGAVIVSRTYPLPGGGKLQVPIQDYRGLDGLRLEGRGVTPNIGVRPLGFADLRKGRDIDVETALTALGSPKGAPVAAAQ